MRFPVAWAGIATQNVTLRVVIFLLSFCLVSSFLTSMKLALKDPLIVERGCYSKSVSQAPIKPTQIEIEGFLREALAMRFNTDATVKNDFIAISEISFREKEQDELRQREIRQTIIVNSVAVNNDVATIDSDRLISLGKIKSAIPFPLKVQISYSTRTEANPYGLILTKVTPSEQKDVAK